MQTRTRSRGPAASSLERRAQVLKALGHPTRLMFVERLAGGERCVCELTAMAGSDVSTVSRHLAVLRRAGVLRSQRRGQKVFYRLGARCVLRLLDCAERVAMPAAPRPRGAP